MSVRSFFKRRAAINIGRGARPSVTFASGVVLLRDLRFCLGGRLWQIPPFAPCVALRRPHRQPRAEELPPPSRPSAYKASRNAQFRTNTCALSSSAVGLRKNNASL